MNRWRVVVVRTAVVLTAAFADLTVASPSFVVVSKNDVEPLNSLVASMIR